MEGNFTGAWTPSTQCGLDSIAQISTSTDERLGEKTADYIHRRRQSHAHRAWEAPGWLGHKPELGGDQATGLRFWQAGAQGRPSMCGTRPW